MNDLNDFGDRGESSERIIVLGASGGIGAALSERLAARGAELVLVARERERLEALAQRLGAHATTLDATDVDAVKGLAKATVAERGPVTGMVCLVGDILLKPAHRTSAAEWDRAVAQNLTSAFATVRAAGAHLNRGGSVVLMASAAARLGLPNHEAVAATKAGVVGLTLAAAASYARRGIRFNAVAPGLVDTPLAAPIVRNPRSLEASERMHPLGRIGTPEDVASAIAWLLDPANAWVTGQVLGVDGGLGTVRTPG